MAITKVFRSGNSQAVRIPKEFQFDCEELEILKRDDEIVLRKPRQNLREVFDILTGFSKDFFAEGREQPHLEEREDLG
ncbi:MAG: AbrB/MazE/SpoVT family DNA-binding domain-containing protein [Acidobacteria bacterium]|nr:AbrB/MazE/SpoVT family DNA-binding domain-containing protein [Acidobacteriota bacterium]